MTEEIAEMYAQLTPENRRKVDAKINELLEQHPVTLVSAVAQDARETFPEYFAGKSDQEVINEIAEAVKKEVDA